MAWAFQRTMCYSRRGLRTRENVPTLRPNGPGRGQTPGVARAARSDRPAEAGDELAPAVGADTVQRFGAGGTEDALVAADARLPARVEPGAAALAFRPHLEGHGARYSSPASLRASSTASAGVTARSTPSPSTAQPGSRTTTGRPSTRAKPSSASVPH